MKQNLLFAAISAFTLSSFAIHADDSPVYSDNGYFSEKRVDLTDAVPLDQVIAIVNDDIILESELNTHLQKTVQELTARGIRVSDTSEILPKVLDNLILETIQKQKADQRGLKVSDEDVLKKLEEIAKNNQLSLEQLRDKLNAMQTNGFANLRENIRNQMLLQKVREVEVMAQTQITEDEINNYLQRQSLAQVNQEFHLGHIMISLPDAATPQQRSHAEQTTQDILQKLQSGEDFSQMAIRHSAGSQALNGGDLGWLKKDQIPTFFSDALQEMETGQLSKVIKSPVGFHIIQLKAKRVKGEKLVNQYHLHRFLLLSDDAATATQVPANIQTLANNLSSMADFEAMKQEYADMPAEYNRQTDLGWIDISKLSNAENQLLKQVGSNQAVPLASPEGWIILFVEEIKQASASEASKRQQAMQTLKLKKANEILEIWLRRIREDALVEIKLNQKEAS